ncbi:MAG: MFS transporter [bacterium]|nr:MFS transporter [bacterium]
MRAVATDVSQERAIDLLTNSPPFRAFLVARTVSRLGDGLASVALLLYAADLLRPAVAVSVMLLARVVPQLFGPIAGTISDRLSHRHTLVVSDLARALLYVLFAATSPGIVGAAAIVALSTGIAAIYVPAGKSLIPRLVTTTQLQQANSIVGFGANLGTAGGPALGGVLVAITGVSAVFAINAVTFLVSAAMMAAALTLMGYQRHPSDAATSGSFGASAIEGLGIVFRHAAARAVATALFCVAFLGSVDLAALVFIARDHIRTGDAGFGFLVAAHGIGMVLGPSLILALRSRIPSRALLVAGIALMGVTTFGFAWTSGFAVGTLLRVALGVGNGVYNVADDTVLQEELPQSALGRVFGSIAAVGAVGAIAGLTTAGVVIEKLGSRQAASTAGLLLVAVSALTAILLLRAPPAVADGGPFRAVL